MKDLNKLIAERTVNVDLPSNQGKPFKSTKDYNKEINYIIDLLIGRLPRKDGDFVADIIIPEMESFIFLNTKYIVSRDREPITNVNEVLLTM